MNNEIYYCSCNGLKCDRICKELHLYRKRFANPKSIGKQSWTNPPHICPSAYKK